MNRKTKFHVAFHDLNGIRHINILFTEVTMLGEVKVVGKAVRSFKVDDPPHRQAFRKFELDGDLLVAFGAEYDNSFNSVDDLLAVFIAKVTENEAGD